MLKFKNKKQGITLVALIVTIVILLILATITIVEIRETKLFSRAKDGAKAYKDAQIEEKSKIDKWTEDADIWSNMDNDSTTDSINSGAKSEDETDLKLGDYVLYNIKYKDMSTEKIFTEENGWRVLEPGKKVGKNKYNGVKIIPTGIIANLDYDDRYILNATGEKDSYPWKPTAEEIEEFKKQCTSYDKKRPAALTGAAGLYYHADKIQVKIGGVKEGEGKAYIYEMYKKGDRITTEDNLGNIILISGIGEKLEYPTLNTMKNTMKPKGRTFLKNTDEDILAPNDTFTTEEDAAKGFWYLKDLEFNNYSNEGGFFFYWIAAPDSENGNCLHQIDSTLDNKGRFFYTNHFGRHGLRPIICLKDGTELYKSPFQGTK